MIKTLNLDGTVSVVIDAAHAHIRNDSEDTRVCVSTRPDPVEGADGVLTIPPGQAAALYNCTGTLYLDGYGPAVVVSSNYAVSPFKCAPASTSGNGGGGSDVPVLKAGSLGYFVQQQTVNGNYNNNSLSSVRTLIFVPQALTAYADYTMSQDWLDNALDYNGIIVSNTKTPYDSDSISIIDTGGGLDIQPVDMDFFSPNLGTIEPYLDEAAKSGNMPFPPIQLARVIAQGAYFWVYGNPWRRVEPNSITQPVLMLTEDVPLPIMPPPEG